MQSTKIDWPWKPLATFNPVTGCKRGCSWCYARRIHERFHKTPFSDVVFHPDRLKEKPCAPHVFIGSMSDIEYWKPEWVEMIMDYCLTNPSVNFYFLSKNPLSYYGYHTYPWPSNCCLGLTITLAATEHLQEEMMREMKQYKKTFLSIEPLVGRFMCDSKYLNHFEKIIVGAMTGPGAIYPKNEWVESVIRAVPKEKLYWKENIHGMVRAVDVLMKKDN